MGEGGWEKREGNEKKKKKEMETFDFVRTKKMKDLKGPAGSCSWVGWNKRKRRIEKKGDDSSRLRKKSLEFRALGATFLGIGGRLLGRKEEGRARQKKRKCGRN